MYLRGIYGIYPNTGEVYRSVSLKNLPYNTRFLQDNDPKHTSGYAAYYFKE